MTRLLRFFFYFNPSLLLFPFLVLILLEVTWHDGPWGCFCWLACVIYLGSPSLAIAGSITCLGRSLLSIFIPPSPSFFVLFLCHFDA